MADNVTLNSGSGGAVIKTDDDGTAHWQYTKLAYGADNTQTRVTASNGLPTSVLGAVDSNNSSTSTLLSGAAFTGTGTDVTHHRNVIVSAFSDVASATDGLAIQFSSDNTNWDTEITFTISAGVGESHAVPVQAQYMRVVYTNGGTGQASFRLQTILSPVDVTGEVAPLNATLKDEDQAVLSRSVLAAYDGTNYNNISATAGGNLKVSVQEFSDGVDVGNGTVGSETLRVTLASDSTGVLSVDDNGGSLTVDGTVTANAGTGTFTVGTHDVTNAGTFAVQVDGDALTALQTIDNSIFADDAAFTLGSSSVNIAGAIRDDTLTTLTAVEGDAVPLRVNSTGALHVTGSSGSTQYAEDTAHTTGDTGTMALAVRNDTLAALAGTDGDYAPLQVNASGALYVNVENAEGTATDDAAFTPGTGTGVPIFAAFDDATPDSVDEGDAGILRMSANRNLYGTIRDAAGNERGANVNASNQLEVACNGTVTANAGTGTFTVDLGSNNDVQGQVAHDAAASGNPVHVGGYATNSIEGLTQVAAGDIARTVHDLNGVLVNRPHTTLEEHISERVSDTGGTSTAFTNFAAGGAGIHNYVCDVTITNTSATDGYVDLRDGTAGSVIWTFPAPANSGATHSFSIPLKGAANTALAYDVSGALSTVYIAVNGFQAQG